MKYWIAFLSIFGALHAASPELEKPVQIAEPPISLEEMQLPPPSLVAPPRKNSFFALGLSALFPGLGHAYLEEGKTATFLMGSAGLGYGLTRYPENYSVQSAGSMTYQTSWCYGLYAAYRDVRKFNGTSNYSYEMPSDTFLDLTFAPFRPSVLKKPEVWGGLLGSVALAVGITYFTFPKEALSEEAYIQPSLSVFELSPFVAFPVGISEEALFRGYLQSQLAEIFNPWTGIVLSSLVFGALHIPNALYLSPEHQWRYFAFSLPLITAAGTYMGWLTHKNRSLKESVTLHIWYDFVLLAASALARHAASTGNTGGFALTIPF